MTVYFIGEVGTEFVKIGMTIREPLKRLLDMQVGNPRELRIIATSESHNERDLHVLFKGRRVRGEWFRLSRKDIQDTLRDTARLERLADTERWMIEELSKPYMADYLKIA